MTSFYFYLSNKNKIKNKNIILKKIKYEDYKTQKIFK